SIERSVTFLPSRKRFGAPRGPQPRPSRRAQRPQPARPSRRGAPTAGPPPAEPVASMRLLMFHVDSFTCTVTEKGRSPLVETLSSPSTHMDEGILVLVSAEAPDADDAPGVASRAAVEVRRLATQLKTHDVTLLPFAHLFGEPCPPAAALQIIDA